MTSPRLSEVQAANFAFGPDHLIKPDLGARAPVFVRGEGVELIDDAGRRYLDAASGVGVTCLGYGVTEVIEAMRAQAEQLCYLHALRFEAPVTRELSNLVSEVTPGDLDRVFFVSGGSEANESAFKFAAAVLARARPASALAGNRPVAELSRKHTGDALGRMASRAPQEERTVAARVPSRRDPKLLPGLRALSRGGWLHARLCPRARTHLDRSRAGNGGGVHRRAGRGGRSRWARSSA